MEYAQAGGKMNTKKGRYVTVLPHHLLWVPLDKDTSRHSTAFLPVPNKDASGFSCKG